MSMEALDCRGEEPITVGAGSPMTIDWTGDPVNENTKHTNLEKSGEKSVGALVLNGAKIDLAEKSDLCVDIAFEVGDGFKQTGYVLRVETTGQSGKHPKLTIDGEKQHFTGPGGLFKPDPNNKHNLIGIHGCSRITKVTASITGTLIMDENPAWNLKPTNTVSIVCVGAKSQLSKRRSAATLKS